MKWKIGDIVDPRDAYGEALLKLGIENEKVVVLDADLQRSNKTYEFGLNFPDRFFDIGIAEADMVSTASGIASMGFVAFATSFAVFVTGRAYDQIRLQVAYANSNVKLVGVSAGLTIGTDGATHQSLDDIALMRLLPNLKVIVPSDATETYKAVMYAAQTKGPFYIRISRYPSRVLYDEDYTFQFNSPDVLKQGNDISVFASGIMVDVALKAKKILNNNGIDASVINVNTIKPINTQGIIKNCEGKKLIVSLEEHSIIGGLGSAISEVIAASSLSVPTLRIGVNDSFGQSGEADELLEFYSLTPEKVSHSIIEHIKK